MYAKIFNFKFNGVAEAKVAASFISDAFGKLIVANNMRSLNISIGKCGSVPRRRALKPSREAGASKHVAGAIGV